MLLLAEPPRCNMAMKSGYPSKRETVEPCYGERKCKLTLPNINPRDGSIDSIALCACGHGFVCVCVCACKRKRGRGKNVCGTLDFHRDVHLCHWMLKAHACA